MKIPPAMQSIKILWPLVISSYT